MVLDQSRELAAAIFARGVEGRGEGRVRDVDVLQMLVKVALDSGETGTFPVSEISRKDQGGVEGEPGGSGGIPPM